MSKDYFQLFEELINSNFVSREIVKAIIRDGARIVGEKHIQQQMAGIGCEWLQAQVTVMMKKQYLENDNHSDKGYEDSEPIPANIECWRRFQGQFALMKSKEKSPIKRSETRKLTKISVAQTQRTCSIYDSQLIKMGELDNDIDFDPNIENMRQAKLRQISIYQQKTLNDKAKIQEVQEQARQLKRLNVDSKSKYTYDFDGKVVVQKPPDIERYPKSHQSIYERRNLVEIRDLLPNRKLESELISGKNKSGNAGQQNQFTVKTYVPQIDVIVMKEGVTFFDGQQEKKKDRCQPLLEIKDQTLLLTSLHDSNVHMTKNEYQSVTNSQQVNSFQNKTLQLSISAQHLPQTITTRTFQEEKQHNNESLLSYRQPKTAINQSISSTIFRKLNGSISIMSEEQLEELILSKNDMILKGKDYSQQTGIESQQHKQGQPLKPLSLEIAQIPPNILANSLSKLPKTASKVGIFPKLLTKYPRERIMKQILIKKYN